MCVASGVTDRFSETCFVTVDTFVNERKMSCFYRASRTFFQFSLHSQSQWPTDSYSQLGKPTHRVYNTVSTPRCSDRGVMCNDVPGNIIKATITPIPVSTLTLRENATKLCSVVSVDGWQNDNFRIARVKMVLVMQLSPPFDEKDVFRWPVFGVFI